LPIFEYSCEKCEILFESLLTQRAEIEEYREWHPCIKCGERAEREKMSITNFSFKAPAGPTAGSGVHGQSGVHDLDYPKLDKAVGRSSAVKWQHYDARKAARDKIRKESGTNALTIGADGKPAPADPNSIKIREKALSALSKAKKPAP
jgi:hypothetical protein